MRNQSKPKTTPRRRDHAAEDAAAVARGRVDLFVAPGAFARPRHDGSKHRPRVYPDALIDVARVVRAMDRKAYRPLQGRVEALARLAGYRGPTPDHVTLWRRLGNAPLPALPAPGGAIVIDSTGLSVHGPGEWNNQKWRGDGRREFVKLHLARDEATGEIVAFEVTPRKGYGSGDTSAGRRLVAGLAKRGAVISEVVADGAYDSSSFRAVVHDLGGRVTAPPPRNAAPYVGANAPPWAAERNAAVAACAVDRAAWKHASGYHRRSVVETTFSRLHALFGPRLAARLPERQLVEVATRVWLANEFVVRSTG